MVLNNERWQEGDNKFFKQDEGRERFKDGLSEGWNRQKDGER